MEDGEAVEEQAEEESGDDIEADEAPRGHMHPQLQRQFASLAVRHDELAHRQQMHADCGKCNKAYLSILM